MKREWKNDGDPIQRSRGGNSEQHEITIINLCHTEQRSCRNFSRFLVNLNDPATESSRLSRRKWSTTATDDSSEPWICNACIYGSCPAILPWYTRRLVSNFYLLKNSCVDWRVANDNEWEKKTKKRKIFWYERTKLKIDTKKIFLYFLQVWAYFCTFFSPQVKCLIEFEKLCDN